MFLLDTAAFVANLFDTVVNEKYITSDTDKVSEKKHAKDSTKEKSKSRTNSSNDKEKGNSKDHEKGHNNRDMQSSKHYHSPSNDGNTHSDTSYSSKRSDRGRSEREQIRRGSDRSRSPIHKVVTPAGAAAIDVSKKETTSPKDSEITPQKPRCRDFHEKGVCMRGDLCSYDHGVDPVVVEDVSKMIGYPAVSPCAPVLDNFISQPVLNTQSQLNDASVVPLAGKNSVRANNSNAPLGVVKNKRNVLTVPIVDDTEKRFVQAAHVHPMPQMNQLSQNDLRNNLRNSERFGGYGNTVTQRATVSNNRLDLQNCNLLVTRIPRAFNNVGKLFEHFGKFGNIVNVQVNANNEKDTAIVTFSNHQEALAAYRSPEPIFANRFIRVFFHDQSRSTASQYRQPHQQDVRVGEAAQQVDNACGSSVQQIMSMAQATAAACRQDVALDNSLAARLGNRVPAKQRLGVLPKQATPVLDSSDEESAQAEDSIRRPSHREAMHSSDADKESLRIAVAEQQHAASVSSSLNVVNTSHDKTTGAYASTTKQMQQRAQQQVRLQKELRVKQLSLLQGYRKQMAVLLVKLEKATAVADKRRIAATVKAVNIKVRDLEKELKIKQSQPASKKEAQRQLLDLEMEIYQKELSRESVTELKKRLMDLRRQLGLGSGLVRRQSSSASGNAIPIAPPRLPSASQTRLDKRPRTLYITGHDEDQYDSLMTELAVSGLRVTTYKQELMEGTPVAIVTFGSRAEAEQVRQLYPDCVALCTYALVSFVLYQ